MVASRLKPEMRKAKINCTELAEMIGITGSALSRRINGTTPWMWHEVLAVAKILHIPPDEWEAFFILCDKNRVV